MSAIALGTFQLVQEIATNILQFSKWFLLTLVPYIFTYIGLPLFILGILLGFSFVGGSSLLILISVIMGYYYIRGTIFANPFATQIKTLKTQTI